jgi:hypothetical protein
MLRQVKPMLGQMQRGMGFGGTTVSSEAGSGSSYRFDSGTRESSLGKKKISGRNFPQNHQISLTTSFPADSDNAYSTYPLVIKDKDNTKDESSSSTLKASNDQIASSSTLDKKNSSIYGSETTT